MTYAYGVLDTYYNWDIKVDDAINLAKRAIVAATYRDAGSGGYVTAYHISKDGWKKVIDAEDVNKLHYQYMDAQGRDGTGDECNAKIL